MNTDPTAPAQDPDEVLFRELVTGDRGSDDTDAAALLERRPDLAERLERIRATERLLGSAFSEERRVLSDARGPGEARSRKVVQSTVAAALGAASPQGTAGPAVRETPAPVLQLGRWALAAAAVLLVFLGIRALGGEGAEEPQDGDLPVVLGTEEGLWGLEARWLPGGEELELSWKQGKTTDEARVTFVLLDPEDPTEGLATKGLRPTEGVDLVEREFIEAWPQATEFVLEVERMTDSVVERSEVLALPPR